MNIVVEVSQDVRNSAMRLDEVAGDDRTMQSLAADLMRLACVIEIVAHAQDFDAFPSKPALC